METVAGLNGAQWLINHEEGDRPVVAGVSFAGGYLDEPHDKLGISRLLASLVWLELRHSRVSSDDSPEFEVETDVAEHTTSFIFTGPQSGVVHGLERLAMFSMKDLSSYAFEAAKDRVRRQGPPYLNFWNSHLMYRWTPSGPFARSLAPVGLGGITPHDIDARMSRFFTTANACFWSNHYGVASSADVQLPRGIPVSLESFETRQVELPVVVGSDVEGNVRISCLVDSGPMAQLATMLLGRRMRTALMQEEQLFSQVDLTTALVDGDQSLLIARMGTNQQDIDRGVDALIDVFAEISEQGVGLSEAQQALDALERFLRTPDADGLKLAACDSITAGPGRSMEELFSVVEPVDVNEMLMYSVRTLMVSVPPGTETKERNIPELSAPHALLPEGTKYKHRQTHRLYVQCSPGTLAYMSRAPKTSDDDIDDVLASVSLDRVDLVVKGGEDVLELFDKDGRSMRLELQYFHDREQLESSIEEATAGVATVSSSGDHELRAKPRRSSLAPSHSFSVRIARIVASILGVLLLAWAVWSYLPHDSTSSGPDGMTLTSKTVPAGESVTLANKSSVMVQKLVVAKAGVAAYANVQICGGESGSRNHFASSDFVVITVDKAAVTEKGGSPPPDHQALGVQDLQPNECRAGTVSYQVPSGKKPSVVRYGNSAGDKIDFVLPSSGYS